MLVATFPEFEVISLVLVPRLRRRPLIVALNLVAAIREYGLGAFKSYAATKTAFIATPYLFRQVKKLAQRELLRDGAEYVFTFQLQSLFDCSVPGIPHYVYTDHTNLANLNYPGYRGRLKSKRWRELERSIYTNASMVFTRSSNISRSLEQEYGCPPEKIACVYVGMNTPAPTAAQDNANYGNKNILFVGTDWTRKGGEVLLEAFSRVLETHPDAMLTIVGNAPATDIPNCRLPGRIPVAELDNYYATASIFCLPTLQEPFGVTVVEAMSHKLPVVATAVGAIPDLVTAQTGILVPPNDSAALAGALLDLLSDPDKARALGRNGFELVSMRYNWASVGQAIRDRVTADIGTRINPGT